MKRTIALFLLFAILLASGFASPAGEAKESLDEAKRLIDAGKFDKALEEIEYATAKINEILSERVLKFLPDKAIPGFSLESKDTEGYNNALGTGSSVAGTATYTGKNDATVRITISSGGLLGKTAGFAALGNLFGGVSSSGGSKTSRQFRQQGYTGTLEYDKGAREGKVSFSIEDRTSVLVEGTNVESDTLLAFAKLVNLEAIAKEF